MLAFQWSTRVVVRVTGESIPVHEGPEDGLTVVKLLVKEAARLPNDLVEAEAT